MLSYHAMELYVAIIVSIRRLITTELLSLFEDLNDSVVTLFT